MMADDELQEEEGLDEELGPVETRPNDVADPESKVRSKLPSDLWEKYDFSSYRNAAVILAESHPTEFSELMQALREFSITAEMIRKAGGNESDIPKIFSASLRPCGWHETVIQGDLVVRLTWREQIGTKKNGKPRTENKSHVVTRKQYLDGHKIDYVKDKVAFDLEWNSKDQTFDRDLYAFNAFFLSGAINVGVLVTRSEALNPVFVALGQALKRDGSPEFTSKGKPRMTAQKYGPSTTWWGKLIYRLNAGRNGGCPILAVGIRPACISDWPPKSNG
jgi:Restriction endonuclease BglII